MFHYIHLNRWIHTFTYIIPLPNTWVICFCVNFSSFTFFFHFFLFCCWRINLVFLFYRAVVILLLRRFLPHSFIFNMLEQISWDTKEYFMWKISSYVPTFSRHINYSRLFNANSPLYIHIKYIWFCLGEFYGILTLIGYLMPNTVYTYISYIYIYMICKRILKAYIYIFVYFYNCRIVSMNLVIHYTK